MRKAVPMQRRRGQTKVLLHLHVCLCSRSQDFLRAPLGCLQVSNAVASEAIQAAARRACAMAAMPSRKTSDFAAATRSRCTYFYRHMIRIEKTHGNGRTGF